MILNVIPRPNKVEFKGGERFLDLSQVKYTCDEKYADEEYGIIINDEGIEVISKGEKGKFYAMKTLDQLKNMGKVPYCTIKDAPEFSYRGFMIDSARHMQTIDEIKKHAQRFSQTYRRGAGIWKDHFEEMAKKTVLKRLITKWAPKSIEMQTMATFDQSVVRGDINNMENVEADYMDSNPTVEPVEFEEVIEDGVISVGGYAFVFYHNIQNVYIGKNVSVINDYAFDGCWNLAEVNIPNSVTVIGGYAFSGCSFNDFKKYFSRGRTYGNSSVHSVFFGRNYYCNDFP